MERPVIDKIEIKWLDDKSPDLSYLETTVDTHYGEGGKNWSHVSESDKEKVILEYGSVYAACEAYARQDAARLAAYGETWHMQGCIAEATVSYGFGKGCRRLDYFRSSGIWGIESDTCVDHWSMHEDDQLDVFLDHLERFNVDVSNFDELAESAEGRHE